MEHAIQMQHVSKRYSGFALQDISLSVKKGFITGFIGPNGSGKSTTIRCMMNLVRKDAGSVHIFGRDIARHEREVKQRIGFVYDENYFYDDLTVAEMRKLIAPFYERWDNRQFRAYLEQFEVPERKKIRELSKGMKMKFSLAVALSHHADLIIMDEPTSGLDPVFRREILNILRDFLQDEEKTVFFSTHITTDLEQIADYIAFIYKGRLVFQSDQESLAETYGLIKGPKDLLDSETRKYFVGLRETDNGFEGLTDDLATASRLFREEALVEKASLEDIMYYTARGNGHV